MKLLAAVLLTLGAIEDPIDDFEYASRDEAARTWSISHGAPQVGIAVMDGRKAMRISAPFARDREIRRVYVDRQVELDLNSAGGFKLELAATFPKAVGHVTLYFRSRNGWYGAGQDLTASGWQQLYFPRSLFRPEGEPGSWREVDGVRIAFWRGDDQDVDIGLARLTAVEGDVAVLLPAATGGGGEAELRSAQSVAQRTAGMLQELGLDVDMIDPSSLGDGSHSALGRRGVAVLAYNPRLRNETAVALEKYVGGGGKLLVCYALHPRVASALRLTKGRYVAQAREGHFAEMRFKAPDIVGLPGAMRQASWNITTASAGPGARVIGWWFDAAGKSTGLPAVLLSDRGAFVTHILLGDDYEAKKRFLAAILGHLSPTAWKQMSRVALQRSQSIGHCSTLAELKEFVAASATAQARTAMQSGLEIRGEAERSLSSGNYAQTAELAANSRHLLAEAYLRSHPSPRREGRAVWNHSGTGAYPGDWERSAKVLVQNGFNMVLPNMLWAGRAHYPSDVLPRSGTFEQYGDQIAQCVAAAAPRDLEVHVWKVNFNLSGAPRDFVAKLRREGRTQVSVRGEPHDWLCPSHPKNVQLELDSMLEVARRYEVDGLHFDYIRYPGREYCYCDGCRSRFEVSLGKQVGNWPEDCFSGALREEYHDWRCDQITRLVRAVHDQAKRLKPRLKISAAVFGSYPACRESVGQDWPQWIKAGLLDFVCPMDYTMSDAAFCDLVENQLRLVGGRIPMYPGIGATASRSTLSADRVVGQIYHARRLGANGFTIFNLSESLTNNVIPGVGVGAGSQRAVPR
jgi:uncharacterized lipoprotein YddW (UPF0748 family)